MITISGSDPRAPRISLIYILVEMAGQLAISCFFGTHRNLERGYVVVNPTSLYQCLNIFRRTVLPPIATVRSLLGRSRSRGTYATAIDGTVSGGGWSRAKTTTDGYLLRESCKYEGLTGRTRGSLLAHRDLLQACRVIICTITPKLRLCVIGLRPPTRLPIAGLIRIPPRKVLPPT